MSEFLAFWALFVVVLRLLLPLVSTGVFSDSERNLLPFVMRSIQYSAVKAEMSSNDVESLVLVPFRIIRTASWPHFLI